MGNLIAISQDLLIMLLLIAFFSGLLVFQVINKWQDSQIKKRKPIKLEGLKENRKVKFGRL